MVSISSLASAYRNRASTPISLNYPGGEREVRLLRRGPLRKKCIMNSITEDEFWESISVEDRKCLWAHIEDLQSRILELEATRVAYASEFDGDTGNIHQNIRELKAKLEKL